MDGISNSVITQSLDLPIWFPTGEIQNLTLFVTPLDQGCTIVLGYCWLTCFNPTIDWILGRIFFCQPSQPEAKTSPLVETIPLSAPLSSLEITSLETSEPFLPVNSRKPPRVTLINASVYAHACKLKGTQPFQLRISLPEVTGHSTSSAPVNLNALLEDYHNFADMFSKSKAGKLADHWPYDLKITLDEGTVPPLGPIYSLSQEELAALHKFIDENLATGFIHPLRSPCGVPVLFIWKKDGSLRLCIDFQGLNSISTKDQYLLLLILLRLARCAMKSTSLHQNWSLARISPRMHYQRRWMENRFPDSIWIFQVGGNARRPY